MTEPEPEDAPPPAHPEEFAASCGTSRSGRWSAAALAGLLAAAIVITPIWLAFLGWLVYRMALWLFN